MYIVYLFSGHSVCANVVLEVSVRNIFFVTRVYKNRKEKYNKITFEEQKNTTLRHLKVEFKNIVSENLNLCRRCLGSVHADHPAPTLPRLPCTLTVDLCGTWKTMRKRILKKGKGKHIENTKNVDKVAAKMAENAVKIPDMVLKKTCNRVYL